MTQPKSVLIVSVDFLPQIGGVSLMSHYLANGFTEIDSHVRVLAPAGARVLEELTADYELIVDEASNPNCREGNNYIHETERIIAVLETAHRQRPIDQLLLLHPFYYGYPALQFAQHHSIAIGCYFHGFELRSQMIK